MQITIKNRELLRLFNTMIDMDTVGSAMFAYCVAKNLNVLRPYADALLKAGEAYQSSERFKEYQGKIQALVKSMAINPDGSPSIHQNPDGNAYLTVPASQMPEFAKKKAGIDEEYKDVELSLSLHQQATYELLSEEVTINGLRAFNLKDMPKDLNTRIMSILFILVEDPEDDPKCAKPH